MDDLIAFLRARLDEQEFSDWHHRDCQTHQKLPANAPLGLGGSPLTCNCGVPDFVMHDVHTKRRIIDELLSYEATIDGEWGCCHEPSQIAAGECTSHVPAQTRGFQLLALPDAGHPDYREEWRP